MWHHGLSNISNLRKWQKQEGYSELPSSRFFPVIKLSCARCPPYIWRKGVSLSPKKKGCQESSKQALLSLPQFTTTSYFLICHIPQSSSLFMKPSIKYVGLFLWALICLRKLPWHIQLTLNKSVCFSPVNLSLSV